MSMKCVALFNGVGPNGTIVRIKTSLADYLCHKFPECCDYVNKRTWRLQKLSANINATLRGNK